MTVSATTRGEHEGPNEGPDGEPVSASRHTRHTSNEPTSPRPPSTTPSTVRVARNGGVIRYDPGTRLSPPVTGRPGRSWVRGPVTGITKRSRRTLAMRIAEIDKVAHPASTVVMVTLTYGRKAPADYRGWAAHMKEYRRVLEKRVGRVGTFVRKEFAGRRVPHHHLLALLRAGMLPGEYVKESRRVWHSIAGGGVSHLRHGTSGEGLGSWEAAGRYLTKPDRAPVDRETGKSIETGRLWSCWHAELIEVHYDIYPADEHDEEARRFIHDTRQPEDGREFDPLVRVPMRAFLPSDQAEASLEALGIIPPAEPPT